MTYPPTPDQGGVHPPPPDPPIEAYRPPPTCPPPVPSWPAQQPAPYPHQPPGMQPYQPPGRPYSQLGPTGPYGRQPGTDGLAIASLVLSCCAVLGLCALWVGGVLGVVGAVLGHAARKRIRQTGQQGDGMALSGIIVGWAAVAVAAFLTFLFVLGVATDS